MSYTRKNKTKSRRTVKTRMYQHTAALNSSDDVLRVLKYIGRKNKSLSASTKTIRSKLTRAKPYFGGAHGDETETEKVWAFNSASAENPNKTDVNLVWSNDASSTFRKGNSPSGPSKMGKFFLTVRSKSASLIDMFKNYTKDVDGMLATIVNKCNDPMCALNNNPKPLAKHTIHIESV